MLERLESPRSRIRFLIAASPFWRVFVSVWCHGWCSVCFGALWVYVKICVEVKGHVCLVFHGWMC